MVGHNGARGPAVSLIEVRAGQGWTELRLNRPERRNALSTALAEELCGALQAAGDRGEPVLLGANGPVFCAGADLSEGISRRGDRPSTRVLDALLHSPVLIVAAVSAPVYGAGIALVQACPVVVATSGAALNLPEARHGFFPAGIVPYLEDVVPSRRLLALGMTAGLLSAEEAAGLGLFTELVDEGNLEDRCGYWLELAAREPEVARQAQRYWAERLATPGFRQRIESLENMLITDLSVGVEE